MTEDEAKTLVKRLPQEVRNIIIRLEKILEDNYQEYMGYDPIWPLAEDLEIFIKELRDNDSRPTSKD